MSDAIVTNELAQAVTLTHALARGVDSLGAALASLRALLERRTGRLLTEDGRPLAGDDDIHVEVTNAR